MRPIFGVATIGAQRPLPHWACSRRAILHRFGNRADVIRGRAATAADDVEPAIPRPVAQLRSKRFRSLGKTSRRQRIGQTGVGISARETRREPRHLLDMRPHLGGTERAVQPDNERLGVQNGGEERAHRLSGQGTTGKVCDRAGNQDRQFLA